MRYLPLLLLVLAGNVSAQSPWKSDYPEYLPVLVLADGCEQWITQGDVIQVAESELLRARLKNGYPPRPYAEEGLVTMAILTTCVDNGMASAVFFTRNWPGSGRIIASIPGTGIVTGPMTKSGLLDALKDAIYGIITEFLETNQ